MSWLIPALPTWMASSPASSSKPPTSSSTETTEEEYDDTPPQFPLPNSHQRSSAAPTFDLRPPSPKAISKGQQAQDDEKTPPSSLNIAIIPDNVPLGDMRPPTSTIVKPGNISSGGGLGPPPVPEEKKVTKVKKREKVALKPGCSPLDWARLTSSGQDLRKIPHFPMRVTVSELKKHNTTEDAWSAFNGRVYNITPYLDFHPGGVKELMRCAGRDGTKLFMATHAWVNVEVMMDACLVGMLVPG